ncbi:uncharacterized protein KIAA0513-like, partial [Neolamprologus brichardi]|uniref:uncharacterized protein KIAA0513-like n=1 Tax=Neolamprologus brichardi TaxID=32507 RepID=UPI001643A0B6
LVLCSQRCHSKCVSEATFYRLVQSFAVVLFECYQMDDYSPAKNLMTMCFTYYYVGKSQPSPSELLDRGGAPAGLDSYLNKANTWLSGKKDAAERLLKHTSKTDVKGFFGGLESKLRSSVAPKSDLKRVHVLSVRHTLRFWNAAFFDAVHCERKKRSPTTRGTQDEEKDVRSVPLFVQKNKKKQAKIKV